MKTRMRIEISYEKSFRRAGMVGSFLGMLLFLGCSEEEPSGRESLVRPVRTEAVFATGGARVRSFSGVSQAGAESRLSFRVPGRIVALPVTVGDRVSPGSLIAELDRTDFELKVQEAEAALRQAEAQRSNAEANFQRVGRLYENDQASRNEYDTARTAVDTARASVDTMRKRVEYAQQQLEYTRLEAPTSGAISSVEVETNENVSAGKPVVILTSGSVPEVAVGMPEQLIAEVDRGDSVRVEFDALPGQEFAAIVSEVGVSSGQRSTTFPVIVRLTRRDSRILPGMTAEVFFSFQSERDRRVYHVPTHAVGEDAEGRFTYIVQAEGGAEGIVERRSVTVGELGTDGIEVLEGLRDGDQVVTAGVNRIQEGMRVEVLGAEEQ